MVQLAEKNYRKPQQLGLFKITEENVFCVLTENLKENVVALS